MSVARDTEAVDLYSVTIFVFTLLVHCLQSLMMFYAPNYFYIPGVSPKFSCRSFTHYNSFEIFHTYMSRKSS